MQGMAVKTALMANHKGGIRKAAAGFYISLQKQTKPEYKDCREQKYAAKNERAYFFHNSIII